MTFHEPFPFSNEARNKDVLARATIAVSTQQESPNTCHPRREVHPQNHALHDALLNGFFMGYLMVGWNFTTIKDSEAATLHGTIECPESREPLRFQDLEVFLDISPLPTTLKKAPLMSASAPPTIHLGC